MTAAPAGSRRPRVARSAPDPGHFWKVVRQFATGVSVVTTGRGVSAHGATVTSFTFISHDPPLVSVCLKEGSVLLDLIGPRGSFTVNMLSSEQTALARHFADRRRRPGAAQFDGVPWRPSPEGTPLLADAVGWLRCRVWRRMRAGDHELILARVTSVADGMGRPLLYFGGRLHPAAIEDAP
ncbi:flavin reductase family protein [Streptomyces sp. NPDC086554]|uniref:flavin reductase family protein n=1 Tax=Streptomyces sp. NPDC086554 TaxID=3154864 RepID=UPI0034180E6A